VLPAIELLAVGFVKKKRPAAPVEAVLKEGDPLRADVDEGKPGAEAGAIGAFEDDDVPDATGVDFAEEGIEVLPGGEPVGAVGLRDDLTKMFAADARFVGDGGTLLGFNAGD